MKTVQTSYSIIPNCRISLTILRTLFYGLIIIVFNSCTVTNNLYLNDPVPVGNKNYDVYVGVGTGFQPKTDTIADNGDITFSNKIAYAPNLCIGAQLGIADRVDIRIALHLPYVIGGFGLRVGPQYSFFSPESKVNLAIGSDLGFVYAKDSIKILGTTSPLDIYANGGIHGDLFMPLSIRFNSNSRLILTSRYSFNTLFVRFNTHERETKNLILKFLLSPLG